MRRARDPSALRSYLEYAPGAHGPHRFPTHRRRAPSPTCRDARGPGRGPSLHAAAGGSPRRPRARAHALADHEPARVGPRAHRRLRGPVAGPPPRRPGAAAARPRRAVRRLRDAPLASGAKRSCSTPPKPAPTWRRCASGSHARSPDRGIGDGVLTELVVRHELQHSETMRQTLALAGLLPTGRAVAAGAHRRGGMAGAPRREPF